MVGHVNKFLLIAATILGMMVCWADSEKSCISCKAKLKNSGLIPTYADSNTMGNLKVVFPENNPMQCGGKMPLLKVQNAPSLTVDLTNVCDLASIVMFDPDTPTKGYLYWFVGNVLTSVLKNKFDGNSGKTFAAYHPPGPPSATGDHRFTICIYCQKGKIKSQKYISRVQRLNFDPRELAQSKSLGSPKSCSFMYFVVDSKLQPDSPFKKVPKVV